LKYVAYCDEVGDLQAYVSLDAGPCQKRIDFAVPRIRRYDANVVITAKTFQR
jgi:hypothetical protein